MDEWTRDRVLDGARLVAGDDVVDVGAGDGLLTFGALERIGDGWVYAVDPSAEALEELERRAEEILATGIVYLVGDARVLPLPDASVDAAVTCSVPADDDLAEAARELHRVLRPGARVSFCEQHDREAACDELVRALREAGFADVELEVESQAGEPPVRRAAFVRAHRP